jgi:predicted DCC family thiol-disulfide oxidoreductase YuxK
MLTTVWNQAAYENNIVYSSLALMMIGLYEPGRINLLRSLVVLCYFGAALDKLLSSGWRSGAFFDVWAGNVMQHPGYLALAPYLPPLALAQLLSWSTISLEFAFMAAFLWPRMTPRAIPFVVLFHLGLTLFDNNPYGLYTVSMSVTTLAFVPWERFRGVVLYDDDCGICTQTRRLFERLSDRWRWTPNRLAPQYGVTQAQADDALYVVTDHEVVLAFRAFRRIVFSLPITHVLLATLFAFAYRTPDYRLGQLAFAAFVAGALVLLTPTVVGDAVYYAFAKRRYLISHACGLAGTSPPGK